MWTKVTGEEEMMVNGGRFRRLSREYHSQHGAWSESCDES